MKYQLRLIPAFAILLIAPLSAGAQSPFETGICPGAAEIGVEPRVTRMVVAGAEPRVHFIHDRDAKSRPACPGLAEACKRKGFVVPGDDVLVGAVKDGIACVTYIAPNVRRVKGQFAETAGFLPASALAPAPASPPKLEDWLGTWSRNAEADIEIKAGKGGKLLIVGSATFGALDPVRVKNGAVNSGELDGEAVPKGNRAFFGEGYKGEVFPDDAAECQARLQLYGRYLLVEDSGGCGGMNVRFFGVYVRLKQG